MSRAFTVIELVIVGALVALSLFVIINVFQRARERSMLDSSARTVASLIEKAHTETLSGKGGYAYGVHVDADRAVLFRGAYNANEATNVTEQFDPALSASVSIEGGGNDIMFARLTGKASRYGTTTLSLLSDPAKVKHVVVTESGAVTIK